MEALAQRLGLTLTPRPAAQGALMNLRWSHAGQAEGGATTVADVAARYLESMSGEVETRAAATRDLRDHILPHFGQLRLDQVSRSDVIAWLTTKGDAAAGEPGTDTRLHALMTQMWNLAAKLELPGSEANPLEGSLRFDRRGVQEAVLSHEQAERLLRAAGASANRQLKFILGLLMLTGARPRELLSARWESLDLDAGNWRVATGGGTTHDLRLSPAAITLLRALPRWEDCPFLIPNPVTRRPYGSVAGSWEAVKAQLHVHPLELDDLRFCDLGAEAWEASLLALVLDDTACGPPGREPSAVGTIQARGAEAACS
jgi:integrase